MVESRPTFNKKSDIWAFGCLFYKLCTREKAFAGDEVATVMFAQKGSLREVTITDLSEPQNRQLCALIRDILHPVPRTDALKEGFASLNIGPNTIPIEIINLEKKVLYGPVDRTTAGELAALYDVRGIDGSAAIKRWQTNYRQKETNRDSCFG